MLTVLTHSHPAELSSQQDNKLAQELKTCRAVDRGRSEQWGYLSPYRKKRLPSRLPGGKCRFISRDSVSSSSCRAETKLSLKHWLTAKRPSEHRTGTELIKHFSKLHFQQQQGSPKLNPMKAKLSLCGGASLTTGG